MYEMKEIIRETIGVSLLCNIEKEKAAMLETWG